MTSRRGVCALLPVLLWCLAANAQTAGQPTPPGTVHLTLPQAVETAQRSHPDVISAQAAVVQAQAQARIQRAALYPQLNLELTGSYSQSLPRLVSVGGGTIQSSGARSTSRDADVALSYTLWQTGRSEQIRRAEVLAAAEKLGIPDAQRLLCYEVRQTYYNVLADQQLLRVQLQALAAAERHREQAQARIDAGSAAESDLLPIEVEVAQARLAGVQAETNLEGALATLKSLLQLPPSTTLELADARPGGQAEGTLNDMLLLAENNRPDLSQQKLTVRAAELARRAAEREAGVQFSAGVNADYGRHTGVTGESWTLSAGASYPLFDAGSTRATVTSARASEVRAAQALTSLRLSIQEGVESSYSALRQSLEAIGVAAVGKRNADNSLAAAEARYREGLAIIIEVIDAQVALQKAQVAEVQARYDHAVALAALAYAVGTEVPGITELPATTGEPQ